MYKLSSKLKTFSLALMVIGVLGLGYSFLTTPKTVEDVKEIMSHSDATHADEATTHVEDTHSEAKTDVVTEVEHASEDAHAEHALHLMQNRPWSAVYVAIFFFFMLSLGTLAFYAIQHASQAGWSVVLFRVMEAITAYLPIGAVILFVFLVLSSLHLNHLFAWMNSDLIDPASPNYDHLLADKSGYLNIPFFLARAAIYIIGWILYRNYARKLTLAQDKASDNKNYTKLFKSSAAFLVFFLVTESMMSWDWIMSIDHHWFSTLFGWYVFASMIVSAVTTIALISIYLKRQGYLEFVNNSHLHDLAKFMFGFSVFWTYLWFSQFMLIWYANIPEEVTYFAARFEDYKIPFLGMLVLNFLFPLLVLMDSDFKRKSLFIMAAGIIILLGHYIDIYMMIMPGTVAEYWSFGIPEISALLLFLGLFIYVVFNALAKAPLLAKGNPFLEESKHFHY